MRRGPISKSRFRKRSKFLVSFMILALSFSIQVERSDALIVANSTLNISGGTGAWSSALATANGSSTNNSYQITWTGNGNRQNELLAVVNTGNFDLIATHLTFSSVKSNGDTTNPPTLTFETCSGTWNLTTFACSGTITQIGSSTSGQIDINRYLTPGNRSVIRVTNARNNTGNYITTFNSRTFRSDIRFGIVINS